MKKRADTFGALAPKVSANGWPVLPIVAGQKNPAVEREWPDYHFKTADAKGKYESCGLGILCGEVVGVDIDVRDAALVAKLEALAEQMLGKAPRRIGNAPKVLRVYRVTTPHKKISGEQWRLPGDKPGDKPHRVEVLAEGQQFVAYGIHPDTGKRYAWNGAGDPASLSVPDLVELDEFKLDMFVAAADAMIEEAGGVRATKSKDGAAAAAASFPASPEDLPTVKLSAWRPPAALKALIEDGAPEGERSEALCSVYLGLHRKGMSPAQIAAVCFNADHGISAKPREKGRGYKWLCDDIARVLAEMVEKQRARDEGIFTRYAFVERQRQYYDRTQNCLLGVEAFNDRHMPEFGDGSVPSGYGAHRHFQLKAKDNNGVKVMDVTYAPGQGEVVRVNGVDALNTWRPADVETSDAGVTPYLELAEWVIPIKAEREHVFDWCAHVVQKPGVKPNHQILLGGGHGIGKDTLVEPVAYAVGGGLPGPDGTPSSDRRNVPIVSNDALSSGWHYWAESQLVLMQELQETYTGERRKQSNCMKPYWAAPPTHVEVNKKYAKPYLVPNCTAWILCTNHPDAIALDDGERRLFPIWSNAAPLPAAEARRIWQWYANGGLQAVAGWLRRRDISKFDARARAPETAWKSTLVETGLSETQSSLGEAIANGHGTFNSGLVSPHEAADYINRLADTTGSRARRVAPAQVSAALTKAGWVALGRIDVKGKGEDKSRDRVTLFARPDLAPAMVAMRDGKEGHRKLLAEYRLRWQRPGRLQE